MIRKIGSIVLFLALVLLAVLTAAAQPGPVVLKSPNGALEISIATLRGQSVQTEGGQLAYRVAFRGQAVLEWSNLGLAIESAPAHVYASLRHLRLVMLLLEKFDELLQPWRSAFAQQRTWHRAHRLAYGLLLCLRTHLTSSAICATGRQFLDWSADYRLFSRSPWDPHALFDPIFDRLAALLPSSQAPVVAALDDTLCNKTGRHIPGATYARDPLSPPFHVNLVRGLRFVQASLLVRATRFPGPARALPVRFEPAPPAVSPASLKGAHKRVGNNQSNQKKNQKKNAKTKTRVQAGKKKAVVSPEEKEYRLQKKLRALTQVGVGILHSMRQA